MRADQAALSPRCGAPGMPGLPWQATHCALNTVSPLASSRFASRISTVPTRLRRSAMSRSRASCDTPYRLMLSPVAALEGW